MKRIGILTAGGDTPALNATVHGAVVRANQRRVEVYGFVKGYSALLNPSVPYVHLNPLFTEIPELDPTRGGTVIGASRAFVDPEDLQAVEQITDRLRRLGIDGLICVGGDGTLNGLQPFAERFPVVLAPKTIDNDLGLNHRNEPDEWERLPAADQAGYSYRLGRSLVRFELDGMVNYVTPGYATAVFDSVMGMQRVRTTAESHRRIAIVEVMGRHSGYIALATAYGQPDIILVPEVPVRIPALTDRVHELYELQKNVVIVCGEGIVGEDGREFGAQRESHDPAGNVALSGASDALRDLLIDHFGDAYFQQYRRAQTARAAVFTRKVGHTQRGGRPVQFDRFYAAQLGGKAVDMLLDGQNNAVAILQWNHERGFYVDSYDGNAFRDRWGTIHARYLHPSFYDHELMRPSKVGVEYLLPIFTNAIGQADIEAIRETVFDSGSLFRPYHSVNTDINKRIRYLQ
ncbi:MAG TPA: 6-phosphofructokinase [Vicinamibacteria bacterium]|nr:6-phosphofructokinase [Vicinamibacteria bacterium]